MAPFYSRRAQIAILAAGIVIPPSMMMGMSIWGVLPWPVTFLILLGGFTLLIACVNAAE